MSQQKKILKINVNNAKIAELFDKILKDVNKLKNNVANLEINKLSITEFQQQKQIILDEISAVKALITADEATLKKIQDIIKDLENVEVGFLKRLLKIENIYFGVISCRDSGGQQLKDINNIIFDDKDFKKDIKGNEPNLKICVNLNDEIARKTDIPADIGDKFYFLDEGEENKLKNLKIWEIFPNQGLVANNVNGKIQLGIVPNYFALKSDLKKIQIAINYPNQLSQTFFQAIDLERNVENGLIGLKSLFDKFFPQRHNFKFEINFNFDTSTGNILKSETKYQNGTLIINFFGNGKQLKFGSKIYDNILDMEYYNDYDNNIEYLKWNYLDNENNLQNSNNKKDSAILDFLKTNSVIINIREGYGLHFGAINWNQESLTNYKLYNFTKYRKDELNKYYASMKNKNCLNCKQLLDNCWCWKKGLHYGRY